MKRLLLFSFAFYVFLNDSKAQVTAQIGSGNDPLTNNTQYSPVYGPSASSTTTNVRSDILFTQAEMLAAGIPTGATITSVQFNKTTAHNFTTPASHKLFMYNSSNTVLSTTTTWASIESSFTQVYSNSSFNLPGAAGWVTWDLSTPFVYTGGALEIAADLVRPGLNGTTGTIAWEWTGTTSSDMCIGSAVATGTPPATLNVTAAAYRRRPNIRITYTPPPLPVKLVEFTATRLHSDVSLNWTTSSEINFSHFEVEFSKNAVDFTMIGKVQAKQVPGGLNNYSFVHKGITDVVGLNRDIYYRLKIMDKDGRHQYSKIALVSSGKLIKEMSSYPCPFSEQLFLNINTTKPAQVSIVITDLLGRIVLQQSPVFVATGNTLLPLRPGNIPPGTYVLQAFAGDEKYTMKLVKE